MPPARHRQIVATQDSAVQFAFSWKTACEEFRRIFRASRRRPSGKNIHALRTRTRRLQAHLDVVRAATTAPGTAFAVAHRSLKRLMRTTGPARDARVQVKLQATLYPSDQNPGLDKFARHLKKRERRLKRELASKLKSAHRKLRAFLHDKKSPALPRALSQDASCADAERRALRWTQVRVRQRLAAERTGDPVAHHRLRVALKKFRYLAEALPPGPGRDATAFDRLRAALAAMGQLHDYDEWLRRLEKFAANHRSTDEWFRRHQAGLRRRRLALCRKQPRLVIRKGQLKVTTNATR